MAAAPAQAHYTHDIPGIRVNHAVIPNVLGDVDLNRSILAGSPIDAANLRDAESVATNLKVYRKQGKHNISSEAVEQAELRLTHIMSEHAKAHYGPVGMDEIRTLLHGLTDDMKILRAEVYNSRIIARNARTLLDSCMPLKKTIPGQDRQLAEDVYFISRDRRRGALVVPAEAPEIGSLPADFNPNIGSYSVQDIAKMVLFYNDNFGIEAGDNEVTARTKFHKFLCLP